MKRKILIFTALLLVLAGVNIACKKDDNKPLKMGVYVESYPEKGRTKINFIDENTLVIREGYYALSTNQIEIGSYNTHNYIISETDSTILLTLVEDSSIGTPPIYFHIINDSKFKIGYLYVSPAVVGAPRPIMTFERKKNAKF